jgi:protein TonB
MFHAIVLVAFLLTATRPVSGPVSSPEAVDRKRLQLPRMVFLQMPEPGGGGGGSGKRQSAPSAPPSGAQDNARDRLNISIARPAATLQRQNNTSRPPQELLLNAVPLASGMYLVAGLPAAPPSLDVSQGPGLGGSQGSGLGGGVGEGTGTGIGAGTGAGLGPGSSRGFGGGAYRLGAGVIPPTVLKQVSPKYTEEAVQRKIQGTVMLEVVVGRDGIPLGIRVTRSLDPGGLDEGAIAAVREWRFTPGRVGDVPVDVLVTIQVAFYIR